jgi:hypothetical protein
MNLENINWNNILESAFGNFIADFVIVVFFGSIITFIITKFFEMLAQKRQSIGALTLVNVEVQQNALMLKSILKNGIEAFEKEYKRGKSNEIPVDTAIFEDAAKFLRISTDNLLFDAFHATYVGLGNLENRKLLEKILNLYTASYHFNIKTGFQMEQLNWTIIDVMKSKIPEVIRNSKAISDEITDEIKKLEKQKIIVRAFKFWTMFK